jgi:tRNA dimethylallyltransferase
VTRHLAIVGPTASGKSEIALSIAAVRPDVEIVSLDSMQVYRGMDIGTAKPSPAQLAAVPHHLVDVVDPSTEWSVRDTQDAARTAIAGIEARDHRALIVGGTGLYVRAVVDGLSVPPRDMHRRASLEVEVAEPSGLAAAYGRLRALDPIAASRIEPGNARRIVRALEVIEATGRPFSSFGAGLDDYPSPALDMAMVGVWLPRDELALRIARRFSTMRDLGLEAEVRRLSGTAHGLSRTARQAIGYKEVLAFLDGALPTIDDAFELAMSRTRKFARRQRVWFRRDPRIHWIGAARNPDHLAGVVLARWEPAGATLAPYPA